MKKSQDEAGRDMEVYSMVMDMFYILMGVWVKWMFTLVRIYWMVLSFVHFTVCKLFLKIEKKNPMY